MATTSVLIAVVDVCTALILTQPMSPLDKARRATEVRKQYESAESGPERVKLARLLESVSRKA